MSNACRDSRIEGAVGVHYLRQQHANLEATKGF